MSRIDEYALSLDSQTTRAGKDFYDVLREKGKIGPEAHKNKTFATMSADDKETYTSFKEEILDFHN